MSFTLAYYRKADVLHIKIVIQTLKAISHELNESLPSKDFLCDTSFTSLYGTNLV